MHAAPEPDPTDVDREDGEPVWAFHEGDEPVPGIVVVERLGVGHRCETWLGWSDRLWSPVVLKLARPHQVRHPRAVRAVEREAAGLAAVGDHPGVPRLHAASPDGPVPHLVVEYLDGPTLADAVDEAGPLAPADVAVLATALLGVLRALHAAGLAHLDVKAENVMLRDGRAHLVDFGSARPIGASQPAGRPVGTPGYSAPEMERCEPIGAGMDVYGLGTVLAEGLAGVPFEELTDLGALPATPVTPWVVRLLDPDPAARGDVPRLLVAFADLVPAEHRPWPAWLDARA